MTIQVVDAVRQQTTLVDLLDWAFRRQRAHEIPDNSAFSLGHPRDSCAKIEHMKGVVGCQIDGGQWKELGHRVHSDAVAVVNAVRALPDFARLLVWQHAVSGTRPDWGEVCHVWPVRRSNGKVAVLQQDVTVVDRRGRRSIFSVSYCPFDIFPNIEYCREEWRMWVDGLDQLAAGIGSLQRWEVAGVGVEREPWERQTTSLSC